MHPFSRRASAAAAAALLALACGTQSSGGGNPDDAPADARASAALAAGCEALPSVPKLHADVAQYLGKATTADSGSEGFQEPSVDELLSFEGTLARLLRGEGDAMGELGRRGVTVSCLQGTSGSSWLVIEERPNKRGFGTYAFNLTPARALWLEAPHADSDIGTLREAAEQGVSLGAVAVLITGTHRCASRTATSCTGSTPECGGQLRVSDAAHHTHHYFTAVHRTLRALHPDALAVNLHGQTPERDDVAIISDGTRIPNPSSISVALRNALAPKLTSGRAYSCNDPADDGQYRPLCGTNNVQGRIDNAATDACASVAQSASGRFLHVEQGPALRNASGADRDAVLQALAEVVACALEGPGLGCAP